MKNFAEKISKKLELNTPQKTEEFINNFYIQKYGSYEKARSVFLNLKESSKDEAEFDELVINKLKNDFNLEFMEQYIIPITTANNFTTIINSFNKLAKTPKSELNKYNIDEISTDINTMISVFKKTYDINQIKINEFKDSLNDIFPFSLAVVRKELGYPHPRTFNPWLKAFFDDKYIDKINEKGRSAGKLTMYEYVEIVSAFMLSYDEANFNYQAIEELNNRFENEKVTQKKFLKEFTSNNYALLKERLEDINYRYATHQLKIDVVLPDEKDYRNIPFSIVSIIKKEFEGYK